MIVVGRRNFLRSKPHNLSSLSAAEATKICIRGEERVTSLTTSARKANTLTSRLCLAQSTQNMKKNASFTAMLLCKLVPITHHALLTVKGSIEILLSQTRARN